SNPSAKQVSDNLTKDGINIGHYTPGSNAYLKFSAKVTAKDLECGTNTLNNIAQAVTNNGTKEDDAKVTLTVECEEVDECKPGIPVGDERCEEIPPELPTTGAGENIAAILGLGSIVASIGYYIASRRALNQ
ncbi:MAG TPA: LPXTG cell wall anchor domain-containing protein, partial [Candidatus Saccharimonadales bacterium]|nr:LPXTG cell wall anchor domain-containing protein [Candidatus Saccharimonadales bacterium]